MRKMLFLLGWFLLLLVVEKRAPLRAPVASKASRLGNNSAVGLVSAVVLCATELPATRLVSKMAERKRLGLLQRARVPKWLEAILTFVLLDYSIYVWHVLLHKVPLLWRFHVVHHTDLDLDTSTTMRFHFGELFFSMFWRTATIFFFGIRPRFLQLWETFLLAEISFHHSNVRLPVRFERLLNKLVVTPRMHGIHHSIVESETNSNWSSGLTVWDYLHRTLKLNVPQNAITIGVPAYQSTESLRATNTLRLPFFPQRDSWRFINGKRPLRSFSAVGHSKTSIAE